MGEVMTACPTCQMPRVLTQHGFHKGEPRMRLACRPCNAARLRERRAKDPQYSARKNAKWQAANPEKKRAHKTVENHLKAGKLKRLPCERCGDLNVHAHHDNYARMLDVMWLCPTHHKERHRELDAAGKSP